jgi:hyperosmotically inducible protein
MRKLVQTLGGHVLLVLLSLTMRLTAGNKALAAANARTEASSDKVGYQSWVATEVRHRLVMLPWYSVFDNLEYRVDGCEVTLLGQVVNSTLKIDAGNAVKNIEGVTKVVNDIEILPPSPMDDQIRRAEFRAIFGEPALERYAMGSVPPIHIVVKQGHVALEGVAATKSDKDLVGIRANAVPGIFSITNNLRIESDRKS